MNREKRLKDGHDCLLEKSRSAISLLQDFVGDDAASSVWSPIIRFDAPLSSLPEISSLQSVSSVTEEFKHAVVNSSNGEMRVKASVPNTSRALRHSPSRSTAHLSSSGKSQVCERIKSPYSAKLGSVEPWARTSEPRLKRAIVSPGPGAYSPAAALRSSIAVTFGHAVNHKLPFRGSYCEENFVSLRAIPGDDKLFGRASACSFTRLRRVPQLNAPTSYQNLSATCSPLIGPGTYNVPSDKVFAHTSGHLIPLGPRGSDPRSFRSNRALKHTYSKGQSDDFIGLSVNSIFKFRVVNSIFKFRIVCFSFSM